MQRLMKFTLQPGKEKEFLDKFDTLEREAHGEIPIVHLNFIMVREIGPASGQTAPRCKLVEKAWERYLEAEESDEIRREPFKVFRRIMEEKITRKQRQDNWDSELNAFGRNPNSTSAAAPPRSRKAEGKVRKARERGKPRPMPKAREKAKERVRKEARE